MAKIVSIRLPLLLFIAFCMMSHVSRAQEPGEARKKKKVEILHTDIMRSEDDFRRLLGNVSLLHNEMYMYCDSAHYFERADLVKAYGNVHIQKGDTLHIYGEYLIYDSARENAEMSDSVILVDKETTLYTDHIFYDIKAERAEYTTGGRIINEENVLTSIIGKYFSESEVFHFKDSVKLVNPDYTMYSDTLIYDTKTEIAYFMGPSEVIGDSLYARCKTGWYDTRNEKSLLLDSARVDNKVQIVTGDSLYYENDTGFGTAFYDVTITDRDREIIVKGNKSWYYKEPERFLMTDSAQFIQTRDNDFLFLHADTLWSVTQSYNLPRAEISNDTLARPEITEDIAAIANQDTSITYRLLRAFNGCRIFSEDMQAKCDSLSYSFRDSVIRMYYEPVIWSDENQLTADSMQLFTRNQEMSELKLYNNSFVIEEIDTSRYQQIKGKNLTGYFRDNSLYKIEVSGNGESIYFAIEEGELIGVNQATCAKMDIYLEEGKIQEIYFLNNPDGSLDPPLHIAPGSRRLENFRWLEEFRPADRWDIFRKSPRPTNRTQVLNKEIPENFDKGKNRVKNAAIKQEN
ncbi:MAG: OstA-like protein [Marinilabiliaceae bacterium]|nr:OstA-like protein [Marinilabiliaceae bacterium]